MLILDTNVLSEILKSDTDPGVLQWLDQQPMESLWITTVTLFEIRYGLETLPKNKRQQKLVDVFQNTLKQGLEGRILSVDSAAAESAAVLMAKRRKTGLVIDFRDTLIAGVAIARRAQIATRNVRHFSDLGLKIINPWTWRE